MHEPSRLESLSNRSLGGSNRGPRADSSLLEARASSDRGPRADSTLDSSLLAGSWRLEPGSSTRVQGCHEPAREQHYSGLVEGIPGVPVGYRRLVNLNSHLPQAKVRPNTIPAVSDSKLSNSI